MSSFSLREELKLQILSK